MTLSIVVLGAALFIEKFLRVEYIGGGDIKLLALVGLVLGFPLAVQALIVLFVLGLIMVGFMKRALKAQAIPSAWMVALSVLLVLLKSYFLI